ncbi:Uncharacterized conserved protein YlxW, UPF0749 family [Actinacidiphila guanduensis]|uniref:Uncharacterized conserved protein YlxW, UPF0749 family n=1 Tax=Actinacidiphila guanduensis TaxID=310781 RepID=A0A1G9XHC1_9ACTN|nr:Uncharacterized conserved protein YlxW, UPF0749 family [Actinacidiphila guanduensis]
MVTGAGGTSPARTPSRGRRAAGLRVLSGAVFALAGLIFWTSFDTAKGVDIRSDDPLPKLSDNVRSKNAQNEKLEKQVAGVRADVDRLTRQGSGLSPAERRHIEDLEKAAGTAPLTGPGLQVTLNDAPPDATALVPGVPDPQPNDLVIHQQDLQAVVNALWQGGAQGIRVMDQRLISTSAVRCVGNTLILQGRVYSPPYRITAVGDQDKLRHALDTSPAITNYLQYVRAYGLGWKVATQHRTTLPGYDGSVGLSYAQPVQQP